MLEIGAWKPEVGAWKLEVGDWRPQNGVRKVEKGVRRPGSTQDPARTRPRRRQDAAKPGGPEGPIY